jgi:hypothetical protein
VAVTSSEQQHSGDRQPLPRKFNAAERYLKHDKQAKSVIGSSKDFVARKAMSPRCSSNVNRIAEIGCQKRSQLTERAPRLALHRLSAHQNIDLALTWTTRVMSKMKTAVGKHTAKSSSSAESAMFQIWPCDRFWKSPYQHTVSRQQRTLQQTRTLILSDLKIPAFSSSTSFLAVSSDLMFSSIGLNTSTVLA